MSHHRTRRNMASLAFGGAVANPAMVLANVLSQMKDKSGRIKIDGFYDDVVELLPEDPLTAAGQPDSALPAAARVVR